MHAMTKSLPVDGTHAAARSAQASTITVARTPEDVERLRDIWNALRPTDIDSDIDYFLTVVRHADQVIRPHVVHIRHEGLDLMAVARLETLRVTFRLGYHAFAGIGLRALVVSFAGILGARGPSDEELVLRHLCQSLRSGEADLLLMRNIDINSTLYMAAMAAMPWPNRAHALPSTRRWVARLPSTLHEFLADRSAKTRSTLRRQHRQLRERFGDRLRLRRFEHREEMDELCNDMEIVASKAYQRGLGVGFSGRPLELGLIDLCLKRGWHRTWMLYLDDWPIAFWTGTAYAGTFAIGTPGFDPDHSHASVGRYTMFRMIEDLCAEPSLSALDYGQGEADYKSAYGHCRRLESDVFLAASRPKAMLVLAVFSLLSAVNSQSRRLAERYAWARRLKASWRRSTARSQDAA